MINIAKKICIYIMVCLSMFMTAACGAGQSKVITVDAFAEIAKIQGFAVNTSKVDVNYLKDGDPVEEAFAYKEDMEVYFLVYANEDYAKASYSASGGTIDDSHKQNGMYVTEKDTGVYDSSIRIVNDGKITVIYNIAEACRDKEAAHVEMTNLANAIGY